MEAPGSHPDDSKPPQSDKELEEMVDPVLKDMDKNDDGYIDWQEFKIGNNI